jgi:hypothetical protein
MNNGMRSIVAAMVGAALMGTGAYWHEYRARKDAPSDGAADDYVDIKQKIEQLSEEVALLRSMQQGLLHERLEASRPSSAGEREGTQAGGTADQKTSTSCPAKARKPMTDEEQVASRERHFAFLDAQLREQPRDEAWAKEAEGKLASGLPGMDALGVRIGGAVCASTLCRLEASIGTMENLGDFYRSLTRATPFISQMVMQRQEDGRGGATLVTYMSRAGQRLPALPD